MSHSPVADRPNRSPSPFIQAMDAAERKRHMTQIGALGNSGRLTLSAEEVEHLAEAYRYLDLALARHRARLNAALEGEGASDG